MDASSGQATSTKEATATGARVVTVATGSVASAASPDGPKRSVGSCSPKASPAAVSRSASDESAPEPDKEYSEHIALMTEAIEAPKEYVKPTSEVEAGAVQDYMAAIRAQMEAGLPNNKKS
jgi:hypothetical protein